MQHSLNMCLGDGGQKVLLLGCSGQQPFYEVSLLLVMLLHFTSRLFATAGWMCVV
jgi:hypothetical protein